MDGIDLVIHADPPTEHKAYVHRSGRTARGGADGAVVTVQTAAQAAEVRVLMRKAGVTPQAVTAGPASAAVRSIAGPPVTRVAPVTRLAPVPNPGARPGHRPRRGGRVRELPRLSRAPLAGTLAGTRHRDVGAASAGGAYWS